MKLRIDAQWAQENLKVLCLAVVLGAGCGGIGDEAAISKQPLAGTINGQAWSIETATAQWDPYDWSGDACLVNLYPVSFVACEDGSVPANMDPLLILIPRTVGSYTVSAPGVPTWHPYPSGSGGTTGANRYATVYFGSGLKATNGRIAISSVTTTAIAGGANITFDADNSLDGQFQATVCP